VLLDDLGAADGELVRRRRELTERGVCASAAQMQLLAPHCAPALTPAVASATAASTVAVEGGYKVLCVAMDRLACAATDPAARVALQSWCLLGPLRADILACTDSYDLRREVNKLLITIKSIPEEFSGLDSSASALALRVDALTTLLTELYIKFHSRLPWSRLAIEETVEAVAAHRAVIVAKMADFKPVEGANGVKMGVCCFNSGYGYLRDPSACVERLDALVNMVNIAKCKHGAENYINSSSSAGSSGFSQLSSNKIRTTNSTAHPMRSKNSDLVH
jgi:hypothetical protein